MPDKKKSEADHIAEAKAAVLVASLPHVAFEGWSAATLAQAIEEAGVDPGLARLAFPRGGVDLALAFHTDGDRRMEAALTRLDLSALRYRDRMVKAIRIRLDMAADREAVRRAAALFALPQNAAEGAAAMWRTADVIWRALGDASDDVNWYSKRLSLSAVYSSCVLFWLGDDSADQTATHEFIDRRIENVMQVEKMKASFRENPLGKAFLNGPGRLLDRIRAPRQSSASDLPGHLG